MRDKNGIFVGNHICRNLLGVDRMEERTCCGGRVIKVAFIRCRKKGVVQAEGICLSACAERDSTEKEP